MGTWEHREIFEGNKGTRTPPGDPHFWVIFGDFWEEIVFLKGLVKFGEIRNIEDLFCF